MIDRKIIATIGALHRVDVMFEKAHSKMHTACDWLVPKIGEIIKDDVE